MMIVLRRLGRLKVDGMELHRLFIRVRGWELATWIFNCSLSSLI